MVEVLIRSEDINNLINIKASSETHFIFCYFLRRLLRPVNQLSKCGCRHERWLDSSVTVL